MIDYLNQNYFTPIIENYGIEILCGFHNMRDSSYLSSFKLFDIYVNMIIFDYGNNLLMQ